MRKVPLAGAAAALVLGVAGALAIPAASHAAGPGPAGSKTLVFNVLFSPFELVQANNVRNRTLRSRWATSSSSTTSCSPAASTSATKPAPA
jgi:hypothetical protein